MIALTYLWILLTSKETYSLFSKNLFCLDLIHYSMFMYLKKENDNKLDLNDCYERFHSEGISNGKNS